MIPKVTLKQLYKDTFQRSTLLAIPQVTDLLEVPGSAYTRWEVFYGIVRDALKTFDFYHPLLGIQKIYLTIDTETRMAQITGNFEAYIKGIISEDQVVLVPAAIAGMSTTYYTASTYPFRNFRYNPPMITDCWYASGTYYVNSICKHPMYEEYIKTSKEPTDNCGVYFMNYLVDSEYSIFYDEVYLQLCRYLMNLKKNMMLQNMPIELFAGLEEDFNRIEPRQQQLYEQSLSNGFYII